MKHWKVDYSVRSMAGIGELYIIVEAADIHQALAIAETTIEKHPGEKIVVWDVGIMEDEVF